MDAGGPKKHWTSTVIGKPLWYLAALHHLAPGNNAEYDKKAAQLSPMHKAPRTKHKPPYDDEIKNAMKSVALQDAKSVTTADVKIGNNLMLAFIVAANADAPKGKSSDFDDGPIINKSLSPIAAIYGVYKAGGSSPVIAYKSNFNFSKTQNPGVSHLVIKTGIESARNPSTAMTPTRAPITSASTRSAS